MQLPNLLIHSLMLSRYLVVVMNGTFIVYLRRMEIYPDQVLFTQMYGLSQYRALIHLLSHVDRTDCHLAVNNDGFFFGDYRQKLWNRKEIHKKIQKRENVVRVFYACPNLIKCIKFIRGHTPHNQFALSFGCPCSRVFPVLILKNNKAYKEDANNLSSIIRVLVK